MDEEGALEKLESGDDEEVVLAIRSFGKEALQACYQSDGNYSIMISIALKPRRGDWWQEYHSTQTLLVA